MPSFVRAALRAHNTSWFIWPGEGLIPVLPYFTHTAAPRMRDRTLAGFADRLIRPDSLALRQFRGLERACYV